jgi:drug/metabolite transporter (DMT)-like permease
MAMAALDFAAMGALVKLLGARLPTAEIVLARAGVSLAISFAQVRRAGVRPLGRRRGLLLLRGLVGTAGLACVFAALARLPLAEATMIQYLHPVTTALLAALVLRERAGGGLVASLALGAAGVLLVARPAALLGGAGSGLDPLGLALAVAGALLSSCAYVTVRKLTETEHPLAIVLAFPLVATPAALPFALAGWVWPRGVEWLLLLGVGVVAQLGQVSLTRGLALEPAARATALSYLQVVFAAMLGLALFGDVPDAAACAGALLILAGTLVAARASRREALSSPGARASS